MLDVPANPPLNQAGAILTVDLDAVGDNYRRLRERLDGVECGAVVKADGYGLGATEVATALLREGCRRFFVAHAAEGIALRRAIGVLPEIYVLNGVHPGAEDDCAAAGLVAVANSAQQLVAWQATARRLGRRLPVAVQVDSGMSRLGMAPGEVENLDRNAFDGLELKLAMSHLACAEEPANPANERQRLTFDDLRFRLPPAPASLNNSSGIFLGEAFRYDLARPGAALYGINPTPCSGNPMRQVLHLEARVIQTRTLPAGTGVGYGHAYRTVAPMRTATIALGYADGWPRHTAAAAFFETEKLPFVGRVSMDSIILDITALAAGRLRPGDLVEVIGDNQTVDEIAGLSGTIGYEILTSLGHRFHRRYVGG
ncbi:MAG: alanine racemase [Hyphomicrobiales bacterium]|nr:alanine racemase [Hyphomicrobiales bacterium]